MLTSVLKAISRSVLLNIIIITGLFWLLSWSWDKFSFKTFLVEVSGERQPFAAGAERDANADALRSILAQPTPPQNAWASLLSNLFGPKFEFKILREEQRYKFGTTSSQSKLVRCPSGFPISGGWASQASFLMIDSYMAHEGEKATGWAFQYKYTSSSPNVHEIVLYVYCGNFLPN